MRRFGGFFFGVFFFESFIPAVGQSARVDGR
jgi:hypothetical protein